MQVTLSNYEIAAQGELVPGENTIRVMVAEQPEGLLGHDLHLARLDEGTDLEDVVRWMDWVDALQAPAPAESSAAPSRSPRATPPTSPSISSPGATPGSPKATPTRGWSGSSGSSRRKVRSRLSREEGRPLAEYFEVRVPALNVSFVGSRGGQGVVLTPILLTWTRRRRCSRGAR